MRLGLENASYVINGQKADAFSVTDISGSMCGTCSGSGLGYWLCCIGAGGCSNNQPNCEGCGGTCENMIFDAQDANKDFIDIVLNYSGSRVGLVAYESNVDENDCHILSNNSASLKNKVDDWEAKGVTCICCGINRAVDSLTTNSSSNRSRSIVVMSDGEANVECPARQGNGTPKLDTIQAACDAYELYGIKVYSIGFGDGVDNLTLQDVASCGNGSYYLANATNLEDVYQKVAENLIEAAYQEQTIEATEGLTTVLYPDSYIEFNYTKTIVPYGLLTVLEQQFHDNDYGDFIVSNNSQVIEARAVSYSGPRWTDNLKINNASIYNLSHYGSEYTRLGDPYSIQIPTSYINEFNTVEISTGTSPSNSTSGSNYNKIIYTLRQNASSYSEIVALAEGCIWNLEFEDSSASILYVPTNYAGSDNCNYKSTGMNISNDEDAIQLATFSLLSLLDPEGDGMIDVKFTEQNLEISASKITGIPYIISTEVQVRRWD